MLPEAKIPESVRYTLDDKEAVTDRDILVMAVASSFTRKTAKRLAPLIKDGQIIVEVAKGIEEGTLKTLSVQIKDEIRLRMDTVFNEEGKYWLVYDDIVINRYTFGQGYVQPTNDDRMDIVNELLFFSNGNIGKYSLENVKKFHADQFEYEIEVVYDLKDLI